MKKYTLIELLVVIAIVAIVCGMLFTGCQAWNATQDGGLKKVIERIWHGPDGVDPNG